MEIRSADANVARDCFKSGTRDHQEHIENLSVSLSHLLETNPSLQINTGWLPASKGSIPLRQLKAIAAERNGSSRSDAATATTNKSPFTHHSMPRRNH